jgi:HECT-domain (ubiquitin-transferase)
LCILQNTGVEKELVPGGRTKSVTFSNRCLYCDLVQSKRLHEFDAQIAAMQHGLAQIVPLSVLRLYTWEQLEVAVAGDPAFGKFNLLKLSVNLL